MESDLAHLDRAEWTNDTIHIRYQYPWLVAHAIKLEARVRTLEAALREYAHHRPWCAARPRGGQSGAPLPEMGACGCGLSEVVRC